MNTTFRIVGAYTDTVYQSWTPPGSVYQFWTPTSASAAGLPHANDRIVVKKATYIVQYIEWHVNESDLSIVDRIDIMVLKQ